MTIKQWTRATIRAHEPAIHAAITAAVESLGLGLSVDFRGGSFDDSTFRPKLHLIASGADPDLEAFNECCALYGLKPEHYGTVFSAGGNTHTLIGLNPRAPKFPLKTMRDGKRYKCSKSYIPLILEAHNDWGCP